MLQVDRILHAREGTLSAPFYTTTSCFLSSSCPHPSRIHENKVRFLGDELTVRTIGEGRSSALQPHELKVDVTFKFIILNFTTLLTYSLLSLVPQASKGYTARQGYN